MNTKVYKLKNLENHIQKFDPLLLCYVPFFIDNNLRINRKDRLMINTFIEPELGVIKFRTKFLVNDFKEILYIELKNSYYRISKGFDENFINSKSQYLEIRECYKILFQPITYYK